MKMIVFPKKLSGISHQVTQQTIENYARVAGDHNPIHIDEAFAAKTSYGRTIAHGMLVMAFISELMTEAFGMEWVAGGKLRAKFRGPVFPGDTVTTTASLEAVNNEVARYAFTISNQDGDKVVTGLASLTKTK